MDLKNEQLLTAAEVCELARFSRQTLWRHVRAGKFPEPVRFGDRIIRWRARDVAALLEAGGDPSAVKKGKSSRAKVGATTA